MRRFATIVAGGERGRASLSAALLCLVVAGCSSVDPTSRLRPGPVDPNSAVAEKVRQASRAHYPAPKFSDVPKPPKDVRTASAWRGSVVDTVQSRRPITQWTAENPPMVGGTEQFAAGARASLPAGEVGAPPSDASEATEAFAAALRAQAAPPPPPQ